MAPQAKDPLTLKLGKDEMNLAEFPIALVTDRVPEDQSTVKFEDRIFDEKTGREIVRTLTITAPIAPKNPSGKKGAPRKKGDEDAYGLPAATDDNVILALIQITKLANNFTSREVEFSRFDLIKMLGWPDSGQSYNRIRKSLKRWLAVTLFYENAWWDRTQQAWQSRGFHILDNVEIQDSRKSDGQGELFSCTKITWNKVVFESFQAGYLKAIDYGLYLKLQHPTAKRMYRFLSKRFYRSSTCSFDLADFAFAHIGLSRSYQNNAAKIKEKLLPGIQELEKVGFLKPAEKAERFPKDGKSWLVQFTRQTTADTLADSSPEDELATSPVMAELIARGVTASTAAGLEEHFSAEQITAKIETLDWLVEKKDKRVAKSPAGYLVKSIQDDYATPKGFISKAERAKLKAAIEAKQQAAEAARRKEQEKLDREREETRLIEEYWESLSQEEQAAIDAQSKEGANPQDLALENGPMKSHFQRFRREAYLRPLLQAAGKLPADA